MHVGLSGCLEIINRRNESQRNNCEVVELLRSLVLHEDRAAALSERCVVLFERRMAKKYGAENKPIDCVPVTLGASLNLNVDSIRASHVGLAGQMGMRWGRRGRGLRRALESRIL